MRSARISRYKPLDHFSASDAASAEHLHCAIDHSLRTLGRRQLGHRRFLGDDLAVIAQPCGPIDEQRCGIDLRRHVGEPGLRQLQVGERLAEHRTLAHVRQRLAQRAASKSQRRRRDGRPKNIERPHRDLEPFAFLADPLRLGHAAVAEAQRGERMRRDHVDALLDLEARSVRHRRRTP